MFLKQSTAVTVKVGPFVDSTDGNTEETALTISQADIRLSKNGGAFAQTNNATGATHDEKGWYGVPLDTTDTGTLGKLELHIHKSGALPVWRTFMVVPANVWDSLFGADKLQVDAVEFAGQTITAAAGVTLPSSVASPTNITAGTITTVTNLTNAPTNGDLTATMKTSVTTAATAATPTVTLADDAITAAKIAANAIGASELAADAANEIADALLDRTNGIETSYTLRQALRIVLAAAGGKASGLNTTEAKYRDVGDTVDRITATVDADGNRTAVTLNVS